MLQWFQFFLSSENVICTLLNKQMTINHSYIPNKQCRYNVNINNPYEKIETQKKTFNTSDLSIPQINDTLIFFWDTQEIKTKSRQ